MGITLKKYVKLIALYVNFYLVHTLTIPLRYTHPQPISGFFASLAHVRIRHTARKSQ